MSIPTCAIATSALLALSLVYSAAPSAAPRWHESAKATPQAGRVLALLHDADAYGLRPEDYDSARLAAEREQLEQHSGASEVEWKAWDDAVNESLRRFVRHVHEGRVTPAAAGFHLRQPRRQLDVESVLSTVAAAHQLEDAIQAIEPHFEHYRLLKAALARYRLLDREPLLTRLPALPGRKVKVGDAYAGASALGRLLQAEGDLRSEETVDVGRTLTPELAGGIAVFQKRHGLKDDGVLGEQTFAALTTPFASRIRQIELTLERWRWLPPFTSPPIVVNIPEFRLFALRSIADREGDMLRMSVIVGRAYRNTRTPVFTGDLRYVVFGPYWDVPRDIAVKEILPKARARPDYLAAHHFELVRHQGDDSPVVSVDATSIEAFARGELRVRQRPGPDNPLGAVKFMLPNDYSVYLHGTSETRLFDLAQRTFSHGCIRVSDPQALAEHVLIGNAKVEWTKASISEAMRGASNVTVRLERAIPVYILYGTAMASEAGQTLFFADVYGLDRTLEQLLRLRPLGSAAERGARSANGG